jgi:site-specific DNA-methyltransferase (adenine-specific)
MEDFRVSGKLWLMQGDSMARLKDLPDNSMDSVVTDPPYGIAFMGKKWDYQIPSVEVWKEVLRVLKPGGHALIACGTRTQHRMVVNIEDAGFEIRDVVTWLYGSGFPKSLNISKAIDKEAGAEREVVGIHKRHGGGSAVSGAMSGPLGTASELPLTAPATEAAKQWDGWGTALKPACEFWTLARKPLSEKTVASNVLKHGTGGLNIDGCRVEGTKRDPGFVNGRPGSMFQAGDSGDCDSKGRFPANLILDEEAAAALDEQSGAEVSRFFYVAKASKSDRGEGNTHPTVKPTKLMEYLCTLVTKPGGIILDPFLGSGSTGVAALTLGFQFVGVELLPEYFEISRYRVSQEESEAS